MDPDAGDIFDGDVLVEGERIAAVGRGLEVGDAEVVDAAGSIVIPGFIDSHRHTWETVIRGVAPDVSLAGYFEVVLAAFAPAYRPEDVYAGNYLGALEAIDAGITTLLDWSTSTTPPTTRTRRSADSNRRACVRSTATATRTRRSPTGGSRASWARPRTSDASGSSTSRATTS